MPKRPTTLSTAALAVALLLGLAAAGPARAQDYRDPEPMPATVVAQEHRAPLYQVLVDVLFVRPIGLPVTAILGGGFWLLGAPVFAITGDMDWWTDACLKEPIRQHITRPLGEL
jgi:hypothetical protein